MKLYFAGCFSGITQDRLKSFGVKNKLYSFYHEKKLSANWGRGLMLDSGAFTAFTKGVHINMEELNEFILEHNPDVAIQLDVIGEEEATWRNYVRQKTVVDVLPVIHYKASERHIKRCLKEKYVCLGGLVPYATKPKILRGWLDYLFSFKDAHRTKIHCLGNSTMWVLERYPFYSCDSSSALSQQRYPQKDVLKRYRQKMLDYKLNYEPAIKEQLEKEKYITRLWKRRGVTWDA